MRKALLITALAGALSVPMAASAHNYGAAGCGLGSIVIGPKPGFMQIFAMTTNGILYSQMFGITFGTSNCADDPGMARIEMQETFVSINMANISRDAASGGGEYLSAMSNLMGCRTEVQKDFFSTTQARHSEIFSPKADAHDVVENFKKVVLADPTLGASCTLDS